MISLSTLLILFVVLALACLAGWGVVKLCQKEVPLLIERRKSAAALAQALKVVGLNKIPAFLTEYSTGDYEEMYTQIHDFAQLVKDGNAAILKEFDGVFSNLLTAKIATPEGRAYVSALVTNATPTPAVDTTVPKKS